MLANINRQLFTQVSEATAFAFSPPAIPGFGNAGGFSLWLQDRSGGSVEFLDQQVKTFIDAARKRRRGLNAFGEQPGPFGLLHDQEVGVRADRG